MRDKGQTGKLFKKLGDAELSRRFSMQDEAEQKAKIDREQANELEYVDESQKPDSTERKVLFYILEVFTGLLRNKIFE